MQQTGKRTQVNSLQTKADVQQAVLDTLEPLKQHFTEGRAGLDLGATAASHNEAIVLMEAFSRPLWGLIPHAAGGGQSDLWQEFLEGIINGTNPEHEEYWGDFVTQDQRMVEQAVFGLGLAIAPEKIWEPLSEEEKQRLHKWLNQINLVDHSNPNNWLMFTVLVNVGFKKVGMPYNQALMDEYLEAIDSYYLADGWYSDGKTDQRDYYIPFAMHYYTLIYSKLMENDDPERAKVYRERAKTFAEQYIYFFSEEGGSIPFGRSLTYRFAQASFWSALIYAGVEPFSLGVMKGIINRHLRWWFDQPIFMSNGLLSIGYAYPNLIMAESYNAPGSPYWAYKAFLILSLPDDHPYWTVEEEPLPALKPLLPQPHARMIICRPEDDGHAVALASGQIANFDVSHNAAKYAKFAYSTRFGFSVSKGNYGLSQGAFDSMLALSECDGHYRARFQCEEFRIEENAVYSRWLPWNDVEVKTWLIPAGLWHVRVHRIRSERSLTAADGGFAVGRGTHFPFNEADRVCTADDRVAAMMPGGISGVVNIHGFDDAFMVYPEANTNLLKPSTMIPTLSAHLEPGEHLLISAVFGASCSERNERKWTMPPVVEQTAEGRIIVQDAESGDIYSEVEIDKSQPHH
ncbi:DUF2264 domain-containing protein [Paenibacillus donghaensis]|uniref:DUF2264 domain-containing protein n=1 Tax=Paenibacillus donghaensis TaxID=414771 RepID=UPI0018843C36|nr:DUF2264 domain-containing protein [Paenibacillus donghaensis]MBE9916179.1 DUF2264 domain-containing protein [Paenibacillus donghaensis]